MEPESIVRHRPRLVAGLCLLGGVLALAGFRAVGFEWLNGLRPDLGRSLNAPTPEWSRILLVWRFCGTLAAVLFTAGAVLLAGARQQRAAARQPLLSTRGVLWIASLLAAAGPLLVQRFVLVGAPLTDDESAYRLMAELLARGRVVGESPPWPLFFDNRFLVNDGRIFAHFFLGWPALMVPGVLLGMPEVMGPLFAALAVLPFHRLLRLLVGERWARVGLVLYLTSPMLVVGAATGLSHAACWWALAWTGWLALGPAPSPARGAALGLFFSLAFFVRPSSALGIGLPLLLAWGWRWWRRRDVGTAAAFAAPSVLLAVAFLAVNAVQTGSPWSTAYQATYEYAASNDFRFALWDRPVEGGRHSELRFEGPQRSLAVLTAGLLRLDVALLGWPLLLVVALASGLGRRRAVLWGSVLAFLLTHAVVDNVGIDTFAPMHFYELSWPLLLLVVVGFARLDRWLADTGPGWPRLVVPRLVAVSVAVALVGFVPVRLAAIHRIAANVSLPLRAADELAARGPVVVFAPEAFVAYCRGPERGWVFARPNNDPDLRNRVLWLNHLAVDLDRELMARLFPDRAGYLMTWAPPCDVRMVPLGALADDATPDAVEGLDALRKEMSLAPRVDAPERGG